jgi:hypothetical protein
MSAMFFSPAKSAIRLNRAFGPPTHFLLSSSTCRRQSLHSTSSAVAPLFVVLSASNTVEPSHLLPSSHPKTVAPHRLSFPVFIFCNWRHWSSTAVASLSLTICLPPPYEPIKGMMRAPPLSTAPTPAPISPHRTRNHLPIGAPPVASFERCCVVIYAAPPPSGTISENPVDLLSLSLRAITTTYQASERLHHPMIVSPPWTDTQLWPCDT